MNLKYFVDVFGNEGEGSLLSYLKTEGLATNLVVGKVSVAYCMTKFEVNVDLTEKGLQNYDKVVEAIFQLTHSLRDYDGKMRLSNEMNNIGKNHFAYPEKGDTMSKCIKLAGKVGKIPEQDIPKIIKHSYYRDQFDKELI